METGARVKTILTILSRTYPEAHIVLNYGSPWELLVAVILSAQCTDLTVNRVTNRLFAKYPTFDAYVNADLKEFEQDIRPTGFYHNKAKNILEAARRIRSHFQDKVPRTMHEILTLPGVARKTANVVLGNAYGVVEGIAVDTHVLRLSQRLRLVPLNKIKGKTEVFVAQKAGGAVDYIKDAVPEKIEAELMDVIPKNQWLTITYRLIDHGRAVCKAQNPKCSSCPLIQHCPVRR